MYAFCVFRCFCEIDFGGSKLVCESSGGFSFKSDNISEGKGLMFFSGLLDPSGEQGFFQGSEDGCNKFIFWLSFSGVINFMVQVNSEAQEIWKARKSLCYFRDVICTCK
ncbi:unnamed protein product [Cuscuta epithymum]|uniref:Uncharacterized protein n=1 Tax=Cuscuta epithymum TaxID=186058 RepID=A0AAV0DEK7_9ASTE|nr:unnamed protein product [Cuscuta epithymum]